MSFTLRLTKPGDEWAGYLCASPACGLPMLICELRPEMLDSNGSVIVGSHSAERSLTCPHCGTESVYGTTQLQRFRTVEKSKLQ